MVEQQSYAKHARIVPGFHGVLLGLLLLILIGSLVNLYRSVGDHERIYSASLIAAMSFAMFPLAFYARIFPLRAQDRAIRAEENLRHFAQTGKLLDPRLGIQQIIGLRFASDAEFPALARRAAEEGMTPDAIKKSVKDWRADSHRV